jgi:acylglycerol lipase
LKRKEFEIQIENWTLQGQYYAPKQVKAVVILIHGMGEYARRYEKSLVPALTSASCAVISYDQFGHGLSNFKKGHHPGFDYLLDSIEQGISKARELFPEKAVFLYGQSMGGNLVINYTLRRKHDLKGVIVSSPFLKLAFNPPLWKMIFGRVIHRVIPTLTLSNELDPEALSRDPLEIEAYKNDPLIHDRISTSYSLTFLKSGQWALDHATSLKTPMLLLHGSEDRITSEQASLEFAKKAGPIVSMVTVAGGYHELHHDLEKKMVLDRIYLWIEEQITIT